MKPKHLDLHPVVSWSIGLCFTSKEAHAPRQQELWVFAILNKIFASSKLDYFFLVLRPSNRKQFIAALYFNRLRRGRSLCSPHFTVPHHRCHAASPSLLFWWNPMHIFRGCYMLPFCHDGCWAVCHAYSFRPPEADGAVSARGVDGTESDVEWSLYTPSLKLTCSLRG